MQQVSRGTPSCCQQQADPPTTGWQAAHPQASPHATPILAAQGVAILPCQHQTLGDTAEALYAHSLAQVLAPHLSNAQITTGSSPGLAPGEVQLPGPWLPQPAPKLHPGNLLPTQTDALTANINPSPCLPWMLQVTPREVQKPTKPHLLPRY